MYRFCELLSARTGRKVRLPTNAQWEYAARVGTSNPTFWRKYEDQYSGKPEKPGVVMSVKSKEPNAWGLYDMPFALWELVSDGTQTLDTVAVVDPHHPPREELDGAIHRSGDHVGKGFGGYPISEMEYLHPGNGANIRFRVAVESDAPTDAK